MLLATRAGALIVALYTCLAHASPFPVPANSTTVAVADKYIVTLRPGVQLQEHLSSVGSIHKRQVRDGRFFAGLIHRYNILDFQAYSGHFDSSTIEQLQKRGDVEHIEPDRIWTTRYATQSNPPYGLNLISHRHLREENPVYVYDKAAGVKTFAYIVDTSIDITHPEFEGRAYHAHNVLRNVSDNDNFGHGTHVAGTIGSKSYGVAKRCSLAAVKVLDQESGSMSDIMSGYDWAVKDIMAFKRKHVAVINMSLGGPQSLSFNKMIDTAFAYGITTVVAAGNENSDAANSSPASAAGAIAVGATDRYRVRAPFSNFGDHVAVFAPGVEIMSTWPGGGNRSLSGTSMASPHIAGLCLYLQSIRWFLNADRLKKTVTRLATEKVVGDVHGSPNLFAYNNGGSRLGIWA